MWNRVFKVFFNLFLKHEFLYLQKMADKPRPSQVTCPLCDELCTIPAEEFDILPNYLHTLHIVELNKTIND